MILVRAVLLLRGRAALLDRDAAAAPLLPLVTDAAEVDPPILLLPPTPPLPPLLLLLLLGRPRIPVLLLRGLSSLTSFGALNVDPGEPIGLRMGGPSVTRTRCVFARTLWD